MRTRNHFFIVCMILLFTFCGETQDKIAQEFMPTAKGEIGSIMLVMDQQQWDHDLGTQLRGILREPMPGLPQDEPLFHLNRVSPKKLNTTLKSSANMIFVVTLDSKTSESNVLKGFLTSESLRMIKLDTSLFMSIRKDEFAKGQIILYLFGIAKSAVMPFHKWLPSAMVAPTPVSALLHAVAVVKSGVFIMLKETSQLITTFAITT